jgi:hypothetical protein
MKWERSKKGNKKRVVYKKGRFQYSSCIPNLGLICPQVPVPQEKALIQEPPPPPTTLHINTVQSCFQAGLKFEGMMGIPSFKVKDSTKTCPVHQNCRNQLGTQNFTTYNWHA